jgi:hypothetical protein
LVTTSPSRSTNAISMLSARSPRRTGLSASSNIRCDWRRRNGPNAIVLPTAGLGIFDHGGCALGRPTRSRKIRILLWRNSVRPFTNQRCTREQSTEAIARYVRRCAQTGPNGLIVVAPAQELRWGIRALPDPSLQSLRRLHRWSTGRAREPRGWARSRPCRTGE